MDVLNDNFINTTNSLESNTNIIQNIFVKGMKVDDFKKVNTQKDNYIESNEEYRELSYNFEHKLHYEEIEKYLLELNKSKIVKLELIGESVDSRNIYSVEIGKGNKTLLIDANIHAREIGNTLILLKYMIEIVNKYENNNKEIVEKLNNYKIVILPCINPDGYEVFNFGIEVIRNKKLWIYQNKDNIDISGIKYNANGIDLNRSMPSQNAGLYHYNKVMSSSISLIPTVETGLFYPGENLGSEPETQALMYFMLKHYKNTFAYIDMHSQGREIYQGKPNLNEESNTKSYSLANYIKTYNNYTIDSIDTEEVGEGNDGSATDFMAELANGFLFCEITGRLSINEYYGKTNFKYKYGVVTLETMLKHTNDPSYFKNEYYEFNYFDMFTNLLNINSY